MLWLRNKKKNFHNRLLSGTNSFHWSILRKRLSVYLCIVSQPSVLTFVVCDQKNRLIEMVLLSTHNMFWLRNKKISFNYTFLSRDMSSCHSKPLMTSLLFVYIFWKPIHRFR